ncbi:hypothetical protein [Pedobacter terrae]|nr:hypothetical protein [Pedobacter terrae]
MDNQKVEYLSRFGLIQAVDIISFSNYSGSQSSNLDIDWLMR